MKKATLGIFGILALTVGLWATVPYTFTANTPAKASEVNANFQSLSDKLTTLESNVSTVNTDCNKNVFSYTHQYTSSNIGDTVTLGGLDYIIVAEPFIEFGTGDNYYIKKPVLKTNNANNISFTTYLYTSYVQQGTTCYPTTFFGFPARYNDGLSGIKYSRNYRATIADPSSTNKLTIEDDAYFAVHIKINQTTLWINFNLKKEWPAIPVASGDVDLRDDISGSSIVVDTSIVDNLRTLINYVEIVKIP